MPSLKYSMLGSPLAFTKGNTASESIVSPPPSATGRTSPHPPAPPAGQPPQSAIAALLRHHG